MEETMELRKKAEAEFHDRLRHDTPFQRYTVAAETEAIWPLLGRGRLQ